MSACYRLVHFMPDPVTAWRIPIAALVEEEGHVRVALAEHQPGPEAFPDPRSLPLLHLVRQKLYETESLASRPQALGPHVWVDELRTLPDGVGDPARWLVQHLLPRRIPNAPTGQSRGASRRDHGQRFLERWGVSQWVKRGFRPTSEGQGWLTLPPRSLDSISQWVAGRSEILLMEPIVLAKPEPEKDVRHISTVFGAYRFHLDRAAPSRDVALVAYILAGANEDRRQMAMAALRSVAHQVVDTEDPEQRGLLIDSVRRLGRETDQLALAG